MVRGVTVANLKINMFAEFRVWRDGCPIERQQWGGQKTRSLLKLLLTKPGRAFSRDEIVEALWHGVAPQAAERSLWVAVSLLRRALEPDLERGSDSRYILQKRPGYAFDQQAGCEVDTWEFEKHRQGAEAAQDAGNLDEAIGEYRSALELLRGEFLADDPYEDWAMEAREEWRSRHLSALSGLSECVALRGRYSEAIETCERALTLDRYSEDLHRRLMLYHYCAGEQALSLSTGIPELRQEGERRVRRHSFTRAGPAKNAGRGPRRPGRGYVAALSQAPPPSPVPLHS
jgi:DNA-binding SARP family transcriptional activator